MSILTGPAIRESILSGDIEISPFCESQLNPNSYDIRLDGILKVYTEDCLDLAKDNPTRMIYIPKEGIILKPGEIYLGSTEERIHAKRHVPKLDGKSSIGRAGISVHITAGYGDVGFNGNITLEITTTKRVRIYPGIRIGQIRFETVSGEIVPYAGNYKGVNASGAVASRSWAQMEADPRFAYLFEKP
jgi:dCTP deaminase